MSHLKDIFEKYKIIPVSDLVGEDIKRRIENGEKFEVHRSRDGRTIMIEFENDPTCFVIAPSSTHNYIGRSMKIYDKDSGKYYKKIHLEDRFIDQKTGQYFPDSKKLEEELKKREQLKRL